MHSPAEPSPDVRDLAHSVTFFLTGRERLAVLRRLRRIDGDRRVALLSALGLAGTAWPKPGPRSH